MRYKQDLAEFIPIADGARLIQERSGLSEDEAREDIVAAVRDRVLESRWWPIVRGERIWRDVGLLPHGFVDSLTPDLIDWENSIARGGSKLVPFTVEIEVSRTDVCRLALALDGAEDRNDDRPELKQDEEQPLDSEQISFVGRPSQMKAIIGEMRRRAEKNVLCPTLAAEARAMCQWADVTFPNEQTPKEKSMLNVIRSVYWQLQGHDHI